MVEQWTVNPCVTGSSPVRGVKLSKFLLSFFYFKHISKANGPGLEAEACAEQVRGESRRRPAQRASPVRGVKLSKFLLSFFYFKHISKANGPGLEAEACAERIFPKKLLCDWAVKFVM